MSIDLPAGPFDVIYADPPWDYDAKHQFGFAGDVGITTGGAVSHYETMTAGEICAMPVASILARNAILFLWTTGPQLRAAMDVIEAWGFDYKTIAFVWDKERVNPGYYTLSQVEVCLAAKRGSIPAPRGARNVRQMVREQRGRHSQKPYEVRTRIEQMFPTQRKLELFSRTQADGWEAWGNQVGMLPLHPAPSRQLEMWAAL